MTMNLPANSSIVLVGLNPVDHFPPSSIWSKSSRIGLLINPLLVLSSLWIGKIFFLSFFLLSFFFLFFLKKFDLVHLHFDERWRARKHFDDEKDVGWSRDQLSSLTSIGFSSTFFSLKISSVSLSHLSLSLSLSVWYFSLSLSVWYFSLSLSLSLVFSSLESFLWHEWTRQTDWVTVIEWQFINLFFFSSHLPSFSPPISLLSLLHFFSLLLYFFSLSISFFSSLLPP